MAFDGSSGRGRDRHDQALTIQIIADRAGFLALKGEWDGLFARCAAAHQVFQSHIILRHWAAHYLTPDQTLCIVTARQGGRLVMIWPLLRQRRFGLDMLRLMGEPIAHEAMSSSSARDRRPGFFQQGGGLCAGLAPICASCADCAPMPRCD